ncbi:MAG: insulinase family protein [Raoultibacter sp.]
MKLAIDSVVNGFVVEAEEPISELDGIAYRMRHQASGARLLYLKNNDENKAFAITFKTPPVDNTGVFHILEHSVLCGSKKFPVKEPFVHLLKSSMQTFLNAMTFPDKTMYPVASTNEQDLMNLMDVYMDAVFNPNIYDKREIFEQEGWHYELDDAESELRYNGVVFNEMKGALSNPDSVLYNALSTALFPDTAYAFESGGDPKHIPSLTYEDFLDAHRRHYRYDNSYMVLYGNMEVERQLAFLDENYLSTPQAPAGPPNPLLIQKPTKTMGVVREMSTAPENASVGLAYVVAQASERERILAVDILINALMGSNEAPLKRLLLDAQIADDINGYLIDEQLQPLVAIQAKGSKKHASEVFLTEVEKAVRTILEQGVPRDRLEASLSHAEFTVRERDFGVADGVLLAMQSLGGWLYDDSQATTNLKYEEAFADLRDKLSTSFYDDLLREIFLESNHMAEVEIRPVKYMEQVRVAEKLASIKAKMSPEEIEQIIAEAQELQRLQELDDSPEAVATLPMLQLSDIGELSADPECVYSEDTVIPCLHHDIPARGINYVYHYLDLDCLTFEDIPYVSVLMRLLGKLDTRHHRAEELDSLVHTHLGSLRIFVEVYGNEADATILKPKIVIGASSLVEKIEYLASIPNEICSSTLFDNTEKIKDILTQTRLGMEQESINAGHNAAMSRVASYYAPAAVVREHLVGIDFYKFLKDLLANFDDRAEDLVARLRSISKRLFVKNGALTSFTGTKEEKDLYWEHVGKLNFSQGSHERHFVVPKPEVKNEAFVMPSEVCFAAKGFDRRLLDIPYSGIYQVANRILSYDYLWNEVRVKGGAYGAGFKAERSGGMQFYSYRDPNLDATIDYFDRSGEWLTNFNPSEEELRGYIISSAAIYDAPRKAREIARRQDAEFIGELDPGWRAQARHEILETTLDQLHDLAPAFDSIIEKNAMCVFGNRSIIENSSKDFEVFDLLGC